MQSTNIILVVVALAALVIVAAIGLLLAERNQAHRTDALKRRFGAEYDRARKQFGRGADTILDERLRHVEGLHIRPLTDHERARFRSAWQSLQAQFIDDPHNAAVHAHSLVSEIMRLRGYPPGDGYELRCRDLSVDHADVIPHYRAAEAIAHAPHEPSTEELRQAVVHYRVIVADLLEPGTTAEQRDTPVMIHPFTYRDA